MIDLSFNLRKDLYPNGVVDNDTAGQPLLLSLPFNNNVFDESGNNVATTDNGTTPQPDKYGRPLKARGFVSPSNIGLNYTRNLANPVEFRIRLLVNGSQNGDLLNEFDGVTYLAGQKAIVIRGTDLCVLTRRAGTNTVDYLIGDYTNYLGSWCDIIAGGTRIILNGKQVPTTSGTTTASYTNIAKTYFALLGNSVLLNSTFAFNGKMDFVQIFNRPLTNAEIRATVFTPPEF